MQTIGTSDEQKVYDVLTGAIEEISNLGIYDFTIGFADLGSANDCGTFTLPREVDSILAVNVCNRPVVGRNFWKEFHLNGMGGGKTETWEWVDGYYFPVFQDLKSPSHLIATNALQNDIGTVIQVFGADDKGLPLQTQNPDGSWQPGFNVVSANLTDLPFGEPVDDGTFLQQRLFTTVPSTSLNVPNHTFVTGEEVIYTYISGTNLNPLISGNSYFIGVIDANNVSLYQTQSNALTGVNPIVLTTLSANSVYSLTDQRGVSVQTQFQTVTPHNLTIGNVVSFQGSPLPTPLTSSENFYAYPNTPTTFTIYSTLSQAQTQTLPIDVSDVGASVQVLADQNIAPITTLTFGVTHDFLTGDIVQVQNSSGTLPAPLVALTNYYVGVISSTVVALYTSLANAMSSTNPIILTTAGTGSSALVKTIPASVAAGDTNNIFANNHNLRSGVPPLNGSSGTPGSFVTFTSSGTLPSPLALGTIYQAENPNSTNQFSLANLDGSAPPNFYTIGSATLTISGTTATLICAASTGLSIGTLIDVTGFTGSAAPANVNQATVLTVTTTTFPGDTITYACASGTYGPTANASGLVTVGRVNITSLGSGQLNMIVSRAFSISFTSQLSTTTANLTTGQGIQLTSSGSLPTPFSPGTTYYINVNATNLIYLYDTSAHAIAGGPTGLITITALGTGQSFLSIVQNVTVILRTSNLNITSNTYLAANALATFTNSGGSLPLPLTINTVYHVAPNPDGTISVYSVSTGNQIILTSVGSGLDDLDISSEGGIILPTTLSVPMNEYTTGDAVTLVPQGISSSLPLPFVYGATYYVRQIDLNTIQLYATQVQALNLSSMAGVITPTTAGIGTFVIVKSVPAPKVARIDRIRKPITNGLITLVAWDYARSCNGPTIIGQYDPTEIEPKYRRIKIGCRNAPIRIAFKRRSFKIYSDYDFLPVTSQQALLLMCQAVDAQQKSFLDLYMKFKAASQKVIEEQQGAQEGSGAINMQFESEIFTDGAGTWMDSGWGWDQW